MTNEFTKDFDSWHRLKKKLDEAQNMPAFRIREVWRCSIGTNVGSEICGKGSQFSRPVLIIKKISKTTFVGLTLTSKLKERYDYHRVTLKGQPSDVQLTSVRTLDARRLLSRVEKLSEHVFSEVLAMFVKIYSPEP